MGSRIDVPRRASSVQAGPVVLGGVAWAHREGISRVEVQINDGPWADAVLDDRGELDTWRQWHYAWDAPKGRHKVTVRATSGSGTLQTEQQRSPGPDGATGWHARWIKVRS